MEGLAADLLEDEEPQSIFEIASRSCSETQSAGVQISILSLINCLILGFI